MAGVVGADPGPLTLRQLTHMAHGRLQAEWLQTASVMALLANINRDPKQRRKPFGAIEFMPPDLAPAVKTTQRPKESADKVKLLETIFPAK